MSHKNRIPRLRQVYTLALVLLLLAGGCVPIQPLPDAAESTVPASIPETSAETTTEPAEESDAFAGDWTGAIAIATIELPFDLHILAGDNGGNSDAGYSATLDIPMQGAFGLPVVIEQMDFDAVRFTILDAPQQALFDGVLGEDGSISGAFSQAGQEGTFAIARLDPTAASAEDAQGTGISETYTDPSGLWSVPVPTGWTLTENEGYVTLSVPDEEVVIHLLALPGDDPAAALAEAWEFISPGFDLPIEQSLTPPSAEGIESTLVHTYDTGSNNRIVQAAAQRFDGLNYLSLFDVSLEAAQRRGAQISIVDAGFSILGRERTNLSGVEPGPLTDEIVATWEAFIADTLAKFEVPGAIVGVVRDGELVYTNGFGYADPANETLMTAETHVMIGSTGKSLTTMLMGILVDEEKMTWDTPAQELYPDFAVMDPALSETITMRNLVCACTGVPRRDLEFLFNASTLSATDVISSLRTFEFFTDFGEAFQYSNQMVATGGYIAGVAAEPEIGEPFAAYAQALQDRVTGPIGMENTTLSFDEVLARGNYAIPHSYNALGEYVSVPITVEETLLPIAPAGSHWSTLEDMAKYMITQLSGGVAPNGERVVSEANLLETRKPQVQIGPDAAYGLGWMVGDYKGAPMVEHGGNTLGFTSDFGFLPDANLGVIVLTNGQATNAFSTSVRVRLLELLYDLPSQVEPSVEFTVAQIEEQLGTLRGQLGGAIDEAAVAPFVGEFYNPILGGMVLTLEEGELFADIGEFVTRIVPKTDDAGEPDGFVAFDPPVAGGAFRLEMDEAGNPVVILGEGLTEYTFELVK